jgi:hypothetical protein
MQYVYMCVRHMKKIRNPEVADCHELGPFPVAGQHRNNDLHSGGSSFFPMATRHRSDPESGTYHSCSIVFFHNEPSAMQNYDSETVSERNSSAVTKAHVYACENSISSDCPESARACFGRIRSMPWSSETTIFVTSAEASNAINHISCFLSTNP